MTREEAIKVLKKTKGNINYDPERNEIYFTDKWVQAYEMAIAAIREQEELSKAEKNVTVKEKIADILNWVQTFGVHWNFMQCLKQELEELVVVAKLEVEG